MKTTNFVETIKMTGWNLDPYDQSPAFKEKDVKISSLWSNFYRHTLTEISLGSGLLIGRTLLEGLNHFYSQSPYIFGISAFTTYKFLVDDKNLLQKKINLWEKDRENLFYLMQLKVKFEEAKSNIENSEEAVIKIKNLWNILKIYVFEKKKENQDSCKTFIEDDKKMLNALEKVPEGTSLKFITDIIFEKSIQGIDSLIEEEQRENHHELERLSGWCFSRYGWIR